MIRTIILTCAAFALFSSTASAQFLIFWDKDSGDWNESDNWFEGFGPPDADIGDVAVISNRGLAFLDSAASFPTGGVILGELTGEQGTLHIRDGGELEAIEDLELTGLVRVGQGGLGTLIVDRGGSLSAELLRSGGHEDSSIVLGGGGGSGNAEVAVNVAAVLSRTTHIVGPNVRFEAPSLNLSGTFVSEILGEQHSTLDISGVATLGGTLELQFSDFQPSAGQTWNLVDASEIHGNFSSITSNTSPGPGLAFTVNKVAGGSNGMVAQLGVDARLQLTVDRRTGSSHIQNLAEGQALTINGYGVGSSSGLVNNEAWKPLAGGNWAGNSSSTHVAEISLEGSREIGPGTGIDLGNVYAFEPTELGEANEDVFFQYHIAGGDVVSGLVDFTGPHNDIVLVVAEDGAYIQNQSTSPVTINGYAIISETGGLDDTNWTSLADGDNAWTEANPANNHLTELNLTETLTLPATSQAIPLGPIVGEGTSDLVFMVNLADSGPHTATVEYNDGVISFGGELLGDCNGDGALNASDLECIRDIAERDAVLGALNALPGDLDGNGAVEFPDFLVLSANFGQQGLGYRGGNIDLTGGVEFPDFLTLSANFGKTAAIAAVPEPSGLGWTLSVLLFVRRRRR